MKNPIANSIGERALGKDGVLGHGTGRPQASWWICFALCVLFFLWTLLPGALELSSEWQNGYSADIPDWLLATSNAGVLAVGGMLLMCAMWIAELMRRGQIGKAGPKSQGSFGVTFRLVATPIHVAWFAGLLVLGVALIGLPMTVGGDSEIFMTWFTWGAIFIPVDGAVLGSLVKKTSYLRWYAREAAKSPHGRPARKVQPFWRSFSYRWRFDLWLCGFGTILVVAGLFLLGALNLLPPGEFGDEEDIAEATVVVWVLLALGVPVLGFGLWSCTQFWRSGQPINTGESAS